MPEPENHALRLLREIRGAIVALDGKLDDKIASLDSKTDRNQEDLQKRIDSLRQAMLGESVLGRYATAEFDERLSALEQRVSTLESRR
jgi:polyhydroxyalkanoate synthesis regulator phasin